MPILVALLVTQRPDTKTQAVGLTQLLDKAGLSATDINYVEAAAPGASLADATEFAALNSVFAHPCQVGNVKGYLGHMESASSIAQIMKVILQMKYRQLLPCRHLENTNILLRETEHSIQLVRQSKTWQTPQPKQPLRAIINAFGATGSGGHILLEEDTLDNHRSANQQLVDTSSQESSVNQQHTINQQHPVVCCFSANDKDSLKRLLAKFHDGLINDIPLQPTAADEQRVCLLDIAYSLSVGRAELDHRVAFVVANTSELITYLDHLVESTNSSSIDTLINTFSADGQCYYGEAVASDGSVTDRFNKLTSDQDNSANELSAFARHWVTGDADLSLLGEYLATRGGRRIGLPTYSFKKDAHWLPRDGSSIPPAVENLRSYEAVLKKPLSKEFAHNRAT